MTVDLFLQSKDADSLIHDAARSIVDVCFQASTFSGFTIHDSVVSLATTTRRQE